MIRKVDYYATGKIIKQNHAASESDKLIIQSFWRRHQYSWNCSAERVERKPGFRHLLQHTAQISSSLMYWSVPRKSAITCQIRQCDNPHFAKCSSVNFQEVLGSLKWPSTLLDLTLIENVRRLLVRHIHVKKGPHNNTYIQQESIYSALLFIANERMQSLYQRIPCQLLRVIDPKKYKVPTILKMHHWAIVSVSNFWGIFHEQATKYKTAVKHISSIIRWERKSSSTTDRC